MCRNISGECSCTGGGGGGGDAISLQGATWASPLSIGITTPQIGNFTTSAISQLNAVNINMSSLSINQFVATDASKNLVSVATPTGSVPAVASTLVLRDTNANVLANNVLLNTLLVTTTGATTNLSASTPNHILLAGTLGQTLKFPNPGPSGYTVGTEFTVNNNCSAGVVTVKDNGNTTVGTVPYGGVGVVICSSIAGNGTWDFHCLTGAGSSWGSDELITPTRLTTTNPTNATSTVTGSIQTAGGVGIVGDVWIGGVTTTTNSTNATSTTTGSIQTAGGMGVVKDLWVGGILNVNGSTIAQGFINANFGHSRSTWIAGVATNLTITNSGFGLMAGFNGPGVPALNDSFRTVEFQILPGTYTFSAVTSRLSNRGFITWYLDASIVSFGSMELYLNGTDTIVQSIASVVIPTSVNNTHTLRAVVTKNVASTGYYIYLSEMWFK